MYHIPDCSLAQFSQGHPLRRRTRVHVLRLQPCFPVPYHIVASLCLLPSLSPEEGSIWGEMWFAEIARSGKTYLIDIGRASHGDLHPIAEVYEVLVRALLLLSHQAISGSRAFQPAWGHQAIETYPFTPIVKPLANSNGTLNSARFGTSWKLI